MQKENSMMAISIMAAAVIIGGAIFGIAKLVSTPVSDGSISATNSVIDNDWVKGNKESTVILIEYSDLQCPACGVYYPIVKQLTEELGNEISFVYRHFPLKQIHKNANIAAQAAEAAGIQDKFWEMHDMIFENQKEWSNQRNAKETFAAYAERLNLDIKKFKNDITSKEVKKKVSNDYQSGVRLGVNSTPTFFINGEKLPNPRTYEEFKGLIRQVISYN